MHTIEEIAALLHIQEKAHANGDLGNIAASALARLRKINEEMGVNGFSAPGPAEARAEPEPQPGPEKEPSDVS